MFLGKPRQGGKLCFPSIVTPPREPHRREREGLCDGGREREHRPALAPVPRCAAGHGRGPAKRERGGSGES